VNRVVSWLAGLTTRERGLLAVAVAVTAIVALGGVLLAVRDDVRTLRARVAAHERELAEVRRAATVLARDAVPPEATPGDDGSLLARLEAVAGGVVGRDHIASMTPSAGTVEDGVAEDRIALRVTAASLADTVRLLHVLETATPPLQTVRVELRKLPDDPGRFDATVEVASWRAVP